MTIFFFLQYSVAVLFGLDTKHTRLGLGKHGLSKIKLFSHDITLEKHDWSVSVKVLEQNELPRSRNNPHIELLGPALSFLFLFFYLRVKTCCTMVVFALPADFKELTCIWSQITSMNVISQRWHVTAKESKRSTFPGIHTRLGFLSGNELWNINLVFRPNWLKLLRRWEVRLGKHFEHGERENSRRHSLSAQRLCLR